MLTIIFILLNYFIIQSSFMVILSINPIYSIFNLILIFIGITIILLFLNVDFIAMLFLIIYIGAVAVLFLFVIMMLNLKVVNIKKHYPYYVILGIFISLIFFFELLIILLPKSILQLLITIKIKFPSLISYKSILNMFIDSIKKYLNFNTEINLSKSILYNNFYENIISVNNIESISLLLYTEYIYLFIIAGLILLIAMIGAIVLTLNKKKNIDQIYYKHYNKSIILKLIS